MAGPRKVILRRARGLKTNGAERGLEVPVGGFGENNVAADDNRWQRAPAFVEADDLARRRLVLLDVDLLVRNAKAAQEPFAPSAVSAIVHAVDEDARPG